MINAQIVIVNIFEYWVIGIYLELGIWLLEFYFRFSIRSTPPM
jgi:hypothetical protein